MGEKCRYFKSIKKETKPRPFSTKPEKKYLKNTDLKIMLIYCKKLLFDLCIS